MSVGPDFFLDEINLGPLAAEATGVSMEHIQAWRKRPEYKKWPFIRDGDSRKEDIGLVKTVYVALDVTLRFFHFLQISCPHGSCFFDFWEERTGASHLGKGTLRSFWQACEQGALSEENAAEKGYHEGRYKEDVCVVFE